MTDGVGTRQGAKISDVLENSRWINGQEWAKYDRYISPIKTVKDIKLSKEDVKNYNDDWINKQSMNTYWKSFVTINGGVLDKVGQEILELHSRPQQV